MDDFIEICLPSLLQPNNIPWLLANEYCIHFDIFTLDVDVARITAFITEMKLQLGPCERSFFVKINVCETTIGRPGNEELKTLFFDLEMRTAVETQMKVIFTNSDLFYGDGSIRNGVVYAQNPGAVVCAMSLRVDRQEALRRVVKLRERSGSSTISNAQLVDISLHAMIPALKASIVDVAENSSLRTSASIRKIADNLYSVILQLPSPMIFSFDASDRDFFYGYGGGRFTSLDHIWATKLIAEHRWRVLGSSDLFFCAEFTPHDVVLSGHSYPVDANRLYNEEFIPATLHSRVNQCFVLTLRAEPTFTD